MSLERPQTDREAGGIGLNIREMVLRARKMHLVAVGGEDSAGHVVASSHGFQRGGVGSGELAKLRVATPVRTRRGDLRDSNIVDHPAFVPPALVIDDEQTGDVGIRQ